VVAALVKTQKELEEFKNVYHTVSHNAFVLWKTAKKMIRDKNKEYANLKKQ